MMLLRANGITQDYGEQRVLDNVDISIYDGDRIGLVGENGAGKSTLMAILAGSIKPDEGYVSVCCPIAYVEQFGSGGDEDAAPGEVASRFNVQESREGLSGGECTRRRIARALGANPRLIMLDEPTTDLDAQGINELMRELEGFRGAMLLISHDRTLLDKQCTAIAELEDGHITLYQGGYSEYAAEKQRRREYQQFEYDEYRKERARLSAAIDARQRRASRSKLPSRMGNSEARLHKRSATETEEKLHDAANALKSRLEKLERKDRPRDLPAISMQLGASGDVVSRRALEVKHLRLNVPGRTLANDVTFNLPTGSKTALVGANGCGKSTLIKHIIDGAHGIRISPGIKIGYFSQTGESTLDMDASVLENAMEQSTLPQGVARTVLNNLMLGAEDVFKPVKVLSGGERVKTALARLLLSDSNMLILDEPTNHLDIYSLEALENVLKDYAGTLLLVSHDRRFIGNVAERMLIMKNGKIAEFEGTPDEYDRRNAVKDENAERMKQSQQLDKDKLRMRMAAIDARLNAKGLSADERETLEHEYFEIARRLRTLEKAD